jgi:hypothetical protein
MNLLFSAQLKVGFLTVEHQLNIVLGDSFSQK